MTMSTPNTDIMYLRERVQPDNTALVVELQVAGCKLRKKPVLAASDTLCRTLRIRFIGSMLKEVIGIVLDDDDILGKVSDHDDLLSQTSPTVFHAYVINGFLALSPHGLYHEIRSHSNTKVHKTYCAARILTNRNSIHDVRAAKPLLCWLIL